MTPQELNRDIKRLYNAIQLKVRTATQDEYYQFTSGRESEAGKEFIRLYYADKTSEAYINRRNETIGVVNKFIGSELNQLPNAIQLLESFISRP